VRPASCRHDRCRLTARFCQSVISGIGIGLGSRHESVLYVRLE
jgi:hypothetical protein